jgi:hypothetical protein
MYKAVQYFGRFQQVQGGFSRFPGWARFILLILALPALLIAALSIALFVVSILALLLLTGPAYRLLSAMFKPREAPTNSVWVEEQESGTMNVEPEPAATGRRQIEVKIVE